MRALASRALGPLLWVWLGIALGVALLAAPAPFLVEDLGRAGALGVNRVLFQRFAWTELGLLAVMIVIVLLRRPERRLWLAAGALGLIVLVEGFLLLPELARRTDLVLSGIEPPPSPVHGIYVGLELAKMLLLTGLALGAASPKGDPTVPDDVFFGT